MRKTSRRHHIYPKADGWAALRQSVLLSKIQLRLYLHIFLNFFVQAKSEAMAIDIMLIGAGIAGLAAGCRAPIDRYQTQIFESHD
ncbi:hypothetical protein QUB63_01440 [Microcoleus sp. ARI1-B5]|uniref:hypothetical protein n=1 Tax=unclassified Microcoleus TaxID=2642155 RepID=UPI002FD64389